MNKITSTSNLPNRYRPASMQDSIVVRCQCTADDLLDWLSSARMSQCSDSQIHGINEQQHRVVITITRINHQIPIGRHSL
jgi:hypothetical protein